MYHCNKCNKNFNLKQAKTNHEKYCDGNGIRKRHGPSYITCEKCKEDIKSQGFKKHFDYCEGKGILNKKRYTGKGQTWIKGKSYTEAYGNEKAADKISKISKSLTGIKFSEERCKNLSLSLKGKAGGIRKGGGRGKKGWYKGYWCDSSWELAWVIYNLDNNIKIERNTQGFDYIFENEKHKYYPDFILSTGEYVEIKGYMTEQVKEKIKQFPYKLNIIGKYDIEKYIIYVKQKYGDDFIRLYGE